MILPVVEAVSHVAGEKTPQVFLGKYLDVKVPHLAWDLFRHSLIHGDYLYHAKYQNKDVKWSLGLNGSGHGIQNGLIHIDSIYLYERLKEYLEQEIAKNDETIIEFETGVIYQSPKQEIIDDFNKL